MWFLLYAIFALVIIVLHYTGWLANHRLEWFVWVLAATIIPAVLWL